MTSSSPRAAGTAEGRRFALLLVTVSGAAFIDLLDVTVVNLAFPDLQRSFGGASVGDLAWVVTAYAVAFAAFLIPAGRLADVAGRRRVFLAGTLLFTLASLASAVAPSLETLIAARFVQGIAAGITLPAGLGLILEAAPPERRAAAIGVWGAAAAVAALVGPTVGGVLVDLLGWRAVFYVNLPVGLAISYGAWRLAAPSARLPGRLPDFAGTLGVVAGIGLVVLAVTQGNDWGFGSARTAGCGVAGGTLLAWALVRSSRHPAPAIETRLWRVPRFRVANVASVLMGLSVYAWMLACVLFVTAVWGYSELEAGLAVSPGAVTAAFAAAIVGRRIEERGQRAASVGGALVVAAVGLWLVLALGPEPRFLEIWLPAGLIAGAGMGAMGVGLSAAAVTAVDPERYAAATGMNLTARQVGGALGVAGLAAILQGGGALAVGPFLDVFLMCSLAALGCAAAALMLRGEPRPAVTLTGAAPTSPAAAAPVREAA